MAATGKSRSETPPRRIGRPQGPARDTREQVLAVAARLFAEKGYHGTGVAEIGEAADLQRGALYYHIGSKEDLLFALLRRHVEGALEAEERIAAEDVGPVDKLRMLLRQHVAISVQRSAEATIYMRDASVLSGERATELQALRERVEQVWASVLHEGEAAGLFRHADSVILNGLLSFANFTFLWYRAAGPLSPDEIADRFTDLLLDGLLLDTA